MTPSRLDRINYVNIALMLVSAGLACVLPFETFLLAYAVLGPLHYLTQISWLHDRRWFTTGRFDWVPLALLGAASFVGVYTTWLPWDGPVFVAFAGGVAFAWVRNPVVKASVLVAAAALAEPVLEWPPATLFFLYLLATVIHVYVFTGLFILAGSLKSRSGSGHASFAVYLACGAALLLVQPAAAGYAPSPYTQASFEPFDGVVDAMAMLVPGEGRWPTVVAIGRFLGFAYTYHYLNWFSKTGIIRWHEIGRGRMAAIAVLYVAAVATYAYDYRIGLMALYYLSVTHVLLEFPLDARTAVDVVSGLRARLTAPPARGSRVRMRASL